MVLCEIAHLIVIKTELELNRHILINSFGPSRHESRENGKKGERLTKVAIK